MVVMRVPLGFSMPFFGLYILGFLYHLRAVGALLIAKMGCSRDRRHESERWC